MKPSLVRRLRKWSRVLLVLAAFFSVTALWTWTGSTVQAIAKHVVTENSDDLGMQDVRRLSIDKKDASSRTLTWPFDSFCHKFLVNTFSESMRVCKDGSNRMMCHGSPYTNMATCTLRQVALIPQSAHYSDQFNDGGIWLQRDSSMPTSSHCVGVDYTNLLRHVESGDYMERVVQTAGLTHTRRECDVTTPGTAYVYVGYATHVYFKFIVWYNLYKSIEDNGGGNPDVMRLSKGKTPFTFPEMERSLFPNAIAMEDVDDATSVHCFEELVLVPWTYSSVLFQCKNRKHLVPQCGQCNGTGLADTTFMKFRRKVLHVCGLQDSEQGGNKRTLNKIVVILRKPYHRFIGDDEKSFSRILVNAEELIEKLKSTFVNASVIPAHMEEFSLCEQIQLAHTADVLVGVHGAGLVHLWWMQSHALMFEIVPRTQVSNPTFKMLSTLTGRRYHGYRIEGYGDKMITIPDVEDLVKTLKHRYFQ